MRLHHGKLYQIEHKGVDIVEKRRAQREEGIENADRETALHDAGDAKVKRGDRAEHEHHMQGEIRVDRHFLGAVVRIGVAHETVEPFHHEKIGGVVHFQRVEGRRAAASVPPNGPRASNW